MNFNLSLMVTAGEVFIYIGYIILALLALMLMIVIHESGHYFAGKMLKFKIEEFAIGFGPAIFKKKLKGGEQFSIRPFPIGGFCAFKGEDEDNPDPEAFNNQKPWKRLIVLFSGALFNFLSSIVFISLFFGIYGQVLPIITSVDSPTSVFQEGDAILAINGKQVNLLFPEDIEMAFSKAGDSSKIRVLRGGKKVDLNVKKTYHAVFESGDLILEINGKKLEKKLDPFAEAEQVDTLAKNNAKFLIKRGEGQVLINAKKVEGSWSYYGFGVTRSMAVVRLPFFLAVGRSFNFAFFVVFKILASIGGLIAGKIALSTAGGTITVVKTIAESTMVNMSNLLYVIAIVSANLAVMNLLPLPALDGSRMVFTLIEWIRGKPLNRKVEGIIHFVGLVLLIVFAVFLDIFHLVS